MRASPLVSVIVPVFNRANLLREAVASALTQDYHSVEVLIVDDGSTDDTRMVARELASSDDRVQLVNRPNGGAGAARESGRRVAKGAFVQHLDSDDVLLPGKLAQQVRSLTDHPECDASYGWTRFRNIDGTCHPDPWKRSGERIATMFPAMLQSRFWDTPTPLYRAALIERAGPWTSLRIEEDWEYDARLASFGVRLAYCEDWVCEVRIHSEGHASAGGLRPEQLRDRARAHQLIYQHARRGGVPAESPEMQHYARELFLLSRQCGAAGLAMESRELFELSRTATGSDSFRFRAYEASARILGWPLAGKLACLADRMRS